MKPSLPCLRGLALAAAATLIYASQPAATSAAAPPFFSDAWLAQHPANDAPDIDGQEAIVIDRDTQQVMYDKDADGRRAPASITKVVTAMVALDIAQPTDLVTVTDDAAGMEPDKMGLTAGQVLSVKDLLYGALLDSGNDAAEALADGLPGGRDQFVGRMNAKVASLGLTNTQFVDPAGLDDANYTTPYDMAVLSDAALTGYPIIRQIAGTKQIDLPATATHTAYGPTNLNDLLWSYPGAYGLKVGYTNAAQYTITTAAERDGHNVLVVVMGSDDHFGDARKLFDWAFVHLPQPDGAPVRAFQANPGL